MPPLCANATRPTNGWRGFGVTLAISSTAREIGVRRSSCSPAAHVAPIRRTRFGMSVQRFALPTRSP